MMLLLCSSCVCLFVWQACGEPEAQFGIIEQGNCGYTNSDGSLPFPREMYAAVADSNEDYPGSCGRCYQVCAMHTRTRALMDSHCAVATAGVRCGFLTASLSNGMPACAVGTYQTDLHSSALRCMAWRRLCCMRTGVLQNWRCGEQWATAAHL